MIQTAAPSVSSSLSLGAAMQAAPADDAAASGSFAALLDSTLPPGTEGAADPATALQAALGLQIRQGAGSVAGKALPGEIADTAAELADAAAKIGDGTGEDEETTVDVALTLPADIVLPGLIVPAAFQLPQTPAAPTVTPTATGDAPSQGGTAQAIRTMPTTSQPAIAAALALQTQTEPTTQPQTAPTVTLAPAAAAALPLDPALAKMVAAETATLPTAAVAVATALPAAAVAAVTTLTPPATAAPTAAALTSETDGQVDGKADGQTTALGSTPKAGEGLRIGTQADTKATAGERPSTLATLTTNQQAQAQTTADPAAGQAKADITSPTAPQPKAASAEVTAEASLPGETRKSDLRAATGETPAPASTPATATLTPTVLSAQDGQALSQTVTSVSTASNNTTVQSGHDFATLVDRLVEAREAANPNTVHASLNHAEFGQVSLRIDQDAKGLSVAMSSADPDFASAVQATAASAQAQTSSDDRQNQQRQDTQRQDTGSQLQQQGASLAGQSQSQSQAFGQGDRDNRSGTLQGEIRTTRANEKSTIIDDTADTRSGIYA